MMSLLPVQTAKSGENWRSGYSCCHGVRGTGKTILMSTVLHGQVGNLDGPKSHIVLNRQRKYISYLKPFCSNTDSRHCVFSSLYLIKLELSCSSYAKKKALQILRRRNLRNATTYIECQVCDTLLLCEIRCHCPEAYCLYSSLYATNSTKLKWSYNMDEAALQSLCSYLRIFTSKCMQVQLMT